MDEMRQWAQQAVSGIRFRPDREAVERELLEHMEDKQELLMRARGLNEQEAGLEAVRQMGDAWQVSRELARIHRPWLGWLWRASRILLILLVAVSLFQWGPRMARSLQNQWEVWAVKKERDPLSPYEGGNAHFGDREQLWVRNGGEWIRAGDYLFRVDRSALWSGVQLDEGEFFSLYCELDVFGLPWQPFSYEAACHIRATDSTGRTYLSTYETHRLRIPQGEQGAVLTQSGYTWQVGANFILSAVVPAQAEWLRLEFDRGGAAWSLTIPLTEGEP